jgi:hypothetical protein
MPSLTERSLERAIKGLFDRQRSLRKCVADDEEIDQPNSDRYGWRGDFVAVSAVASDLRRVVAAMKLSSNLSVWPIRRPRLRGVRGADRRIRCRRWN